MLPPLLVDGVEAEGGNGQDQQGDGDRAHEDAQGEDDLGVVCAIGGSVACKANREGGQKCAYPCSEEPWEAASRRCLTDRPARWATRAGKALTPLPGKLMLSR